MEVGGSVVDRGLQLERTALAWQRTLLSLAVGSVAAGRVLLPVLGLGSWVLGGAGLLVSLVLVAIIRRRYTRAHRHLSSNGQGLPSGAVLIALCACLYVAGGLAGLVFVIARAR